MLLFFKSSLATIHCLLSSSKFLISFLSVDSGPWLDDGIPLPRFSFPLRYYYILQKIHNLSFFNNTSILSTAFDTIFYIYLLFFSFQPIHQSIFQMPWKHHSSSRATFISSQLHTTTTMLKEKCDFLPFVFSLHPSSTPISWTWNVQLRTVIYFPLYQARAFGSFKEFHFLKLPLLYFEINCTMTFDS